MTTNELHKYLDSDEPLTVEQVKVIITELIHDVFNEIANNIKIEEWKLQWYYGEMNGFQIALDLLEKVRE